METKTITSRYDEISEFVIENQEFILNCLDLELDRDGHIRSSCPVHGGDNSTAFVFNSHKSYWCCYTNHCEEKYGSNIIGLIRGIKDCSYQEALEWIESIFDNSDKIINKDLFRIKSFIRKNEPLDNIEKNVPIYNYIDIRDIDGSVSEFIQRGFLPETLIKFGAFKPKDFLHPQFGRACLLLYNENGEIIGSTGRLTEDTKNSNIKWMHSPSSISTNKILFGLYQSKEYIKEKQSAFIVEGPMDVMRMYEAGFLNTVGCLGTKFSFEKIQLLINLGIKNLYILFDPDEAGINTSNIIAKKYSKYFNIHVLSSLLPKDPGDLESSQLKQFLKDYD